MFSDSVFVQASVNSDGSYPPLHPVDDDVVGVVGDVECYQTQVCEIPQNL